MHFEEFILQLFINQCICDLAAHLTVQDLVVDTYCTVQDLVFERKTDSFDESSMFSATSRNLTENVDVKVESVI